MAKSKGGPPKVGDLSTRILIGIRDEIQRLNARVEVVFQGLNDRLDQTNVRLENLRDLSGERIRELDARLRVLEARVLR